MAFNFMVTYRVTSMTLIYNKNEKLKSPKFLLIPSNDALALYKCCGESPIKT